jgi:hypothetical protein
MHFSLGKPRLEAPPTALLSSLRQLCDNAVSNFPKCAEAEFSTWRMFGDQPAGDQGSRRSPVVEKFAIDPNAQLAIRALSTPKTKRQ